MTTCRPIMTLTCDVEVVVCLGRRPQPIAGPAPVPASVLLEHTADDKAPVRIDASASHEPRHLLYGLTALVPVICDVVGVTLCLAYELDPAAFRGCGVLGGHHNVSVAWKQRLW